MATSASMIGEAPGSLRGVHVFPAQVRAPSPHRQQGEVELPRVELAHAVEHRRVACEVRRPGSLHDVAHGLSVRSTPRPPGRVVHRMHHVHGRVADRNHVPGHHLDRFDGELRQQPGRTPRDQHGRPGIELRQRREVEVVHVQVRDGHRVQPRRRVRHQPGPAVQVHQRPGEQGIGEDARAVVDEDGGVTPPGHPDRTAGRFCSHPCDSGPTPSTASHLCQVSRSGWSAFYLPRAWAGRGPGSEVTMQEREGECGRAVQLAGRPHLPGRRHGGSCGRR